jgi:hypothetical protein
VTLPSDPEFVVHQRVGIRELKMDGIVLALFLDGGGWQYQVRYFWNGEAKTVYFFGWEIDSRSAKKEMPA